MLGRLFLLFTLVPLAELYLLITIGELMGVAPTIALVAVTGFLGAHLARREGSKTLRAYQQAMTEGRLPEDGILSGLLILAGGVMLITPGILTDLFGLAMMVPSLRRATAKLLERRLQKKLAEGVASGNVRVIGFGTGFAGGDGGMGDTGTEGRGAVIDAEVVVSNHDGRPSTDNSLRRR